MITVPVAQDQWDADTPSTQSTTLRGQLFQQLTIDICHESRTKVAGVRTIYKTCRSQRTAVLFHQKICGTDETLQTFPT